MADFFGDPRIARGVVACLGQFYKYRTPAFGEVVGDTAARRLEAAGLNSPMALRAHTYAHVNAAHQGFLEEAQRTDCYARLGEPLGVSAHEWATLLHLDAEENQILTRMGPVPEAPDLAALYNFHSLDTPLRRATRIVLSGLSLSSTEAADVRSLARHLGVKATVGDGGASVTLADLEMSSLLPRRPGRLGRCLLHLLQAIGSKTTSGYADAPLGARTFRLALGTDVFKVLGVPTPLPALGEGLG